MALIHFLEGFNVDISYQLRERDPTTLEEMKENSLKVEDHLLAKQAKLKYEKRVTIKEEASSSSSIDYKIDSLLRKMEKMIDRISITDRAPPRENQTGKIRNPTSEEINPTSNKGTQKFQTSK